LWPALPVERKDCVGVSVTTYAAEELIGASGFTGLVTPRLDLFTAIGTAPNKHSVWSDLTIAAFTGYGGPITVTLSAAYISNKNQQLSIDVSDAIFNGPSAGAGVDVIGWVLHDTSGTPVVYALGLFDGPLALQVATDRVTVDETVGMSTTPSFSVSN
jgi:hypothetical protein